MDTRDMAIARYVDEEEDDLERPDHEIELEPLEIERDEFTFAHRNHRGFGRARRGFSALFLYLNALKRKLTLAFAKTGALSYIMSAASMTIAVLLIVSISSHKSSPHEKVSSHSTSESTNDVGDQVVTGYSRPSDLSYDPLSESPLSVPTTESMPFKGQYEQHQDDIDAGSFDMLLDVFDQHFQARVVSTQEAELSMRTKDPLATLAMPKRNSHIFGRTTYDLTVWSPTATMWAVRSKILQVQSTMLDDVTGEQVSSDQNHSDAQNVRSGLETVTACFSESEKAHRYMFKEADNDGNGDAWCVHWDVAETSCGQYQGLLSEISNMNGCELQQITSTHWSASECNLDIAASLGSGDMLNEGLLMTDIGGIGVNVTSSDPFIVPGGQVDIYASLHSEENDKSHDSQFVQHRFLPKQVNSTYTAIQAISLSLEPLPNYSMNFDIRMQSNVSAIFSNVEILSFGEAFDSTRHPLECIEGDMNTVLSLLGMTEEDER